MFEYNCTFYSDHFESFPYSMCLSGFSILVLQLGLLGILTAVGLQSMAVHCNVVYYTITDGQFGCGQFFTNTNDATV